MLPHDFLAECVLTIYPVFWGQSMVIFGSRGNCIGKSIQFWSKCFKRKKHTHVALIGQTLQSVDIYINVIWQTSLSSATYIFIQLSS